MPSVSWAIPLKPPALSGAVVCGFRGFIRSDQIAGEQPSHFFDLEDVDAQARFLLTGSASPRLVRGVSESLAGRVALVDLSGFSLAEVGDGEWRKLWWRGGFPLAYLGDSDGASREWQEGFVSTLLERDLPQLGITIPAAALRRFWLMLTH